METNILRKKMCIWLATLMLACGVCLSVSQTDSFFVYSNSKSDILILTSFISEGWLESNLSVLNPLSNYRAEQMLSKAFAGRVKYHNGLGEHQIVHMIFNSFFHDADRSLKAMPGSDMVYHLCSTWIINYVHLTDGEKG